jgi:hypothetical protein
MEEVDEARHMPLPRTDRVQSTAEDCARSRAEGLKTAERVRIVIEEVGRLADFLRGYRTNPGRDPTELAGFL